MELVADVAETEGVKEMMMMMSQVQEEWQVAHIEVEAGEIVASTTTERSDLAARNVHHPEGRNAVLERMTPKWIRSSIILLGST